jgi:Ricin-type beta-trefoil lectin domain-like
MTRFYATLILASCLLLSAAQGTPTQVVEDQFYRIKNVRSKKVLSVEDKGKLEGAQIIQVVPGPSDLQQWKFVKTGDYYKIVNHKTGMALNVQNESKEGGTPIIQWDAKAPNENQQWTLEKKGDAYAIKARHSGMVIDVANEKKDRKALLIQYPFKETDNDNQLFEFVPVKGKK